MDTPRKQSVSLWHPWSEPQKRTHELALYQDFNFNSIEDIIEQIGRGKYYALCNNILSPHEIPTNLLRHKNTESYLSRTGNIAALRVKRGRGSGFLIPGRAWGNNGEPLRETLENIQSIFTIFGREAISSSSLSEKVLRSTLPDKLYISRPSMNLRSTILNNRSVPRVLKQKKSIKSKKAYEYDMIKAYLSIAASGVPDPFSAPVRFYGSNIWQDMKVSFVKIKGVAHTDGRIQPIQIKEGTSYRTPMDNECFETWCWSGKIQDCLERGYSMEVLEGYSWYSLSSFMSEWANILYHACEKYHKESFYPILKTMTQGLPGRFLKAPEIYSLVHYTEYQNGDVPLKTHWTGNESPMSDWFMRVDSESEKARESAQLTPIGDYIVSECERQIYHAALKEEETGNRVIRIYVDSLTTTKESTIISIGTKPGQFKVKRYFKAVVKENRFYGWIETGVFVAKTPGLEENSSAKERVVKREYKWQNTS